MKRGLVMLCFVAVHVLPLAGLAGAQQLPHMREEDLAGQQVVLPDAASSKVAYQTHGATADAGFAELQSKVAPC
ncbi:MAG TPA: hypothetical protein VMU45_04715 [Candidatus Eisenbacteria bacterium]|nr:hypothetical protein [Candidatus Eisenbacteria bacterium]